MKNIIKYFFLTALVFASISEAFAMTKIDVSDAVSNTTDKITSTSEDIQAKLKGVADTKKGLKFIDAAKEGIKKAKELKKQAEDTMKAAQDFKNSVEENIDSLKDGVAQGAFNIVASNAAVLSNLQVQQAQAKAENDAAVKGYEATRDSTVNKYKENITVYEKMKAEAAGDAEKIKSYDAKISEANKAIQKANEDCEAQKEKAKADFEKKNSDFENQINTLKAAAENVDPLAVDDLKNEVTDKAKNAAMDKAKSLLSGGGNALNSSIAENFYAEDEEESMERNKQINNYRKKVEFEDTLESYYQAVKFMSEGDNSKDIADDLRSETQNTETVASGPMLDISILVEQMRSMLKYAKMQVADLKVMTARDMVKMPKHLSDYSTVMESNLDVYEKIGKGKLGKSKITLDNIKKTYNDAKSGIEEAKSMYEDAKSKYEEAKEVLSAAGELAGAIGSFGASAGGENDGNNVQSALGQEQEENAQNLNTGYSEETVQTQNATTFSDVVNTQNNVKAVTAVNQGGINNNTTSQPSAMAVAISKNSEQAYSPTVTVIPQSTRQAFSSEKTYVPQSTRQAFSPVTTAISQSSEQTFYPTAMTERQNIAQDGEFQNEKQRVFSVSEKVTFDTKEKPSAPEESDLTEEELTEEDVSEVDGQNTKKLLKKEKGLSIAAEKGEAIQENNEEQDIEKFPLLSSKSIKEQSKTSDSITVGRKAFSLPTQKQETNISIENKAEAVIEQQEKGQ